MDAGRADDIHTVSGAPSPADPLTGGFPLPIAESSHCCGWDRRLSSALRVQLRRGVARHCESCLGRVAAGWVEPAGSDSGCRRVRGRRVCGRAVAFAEGDLAEQEVILELRPLFTGRGAELAEWAERAAAFQGVARRCAQARPGGDRCGSRAEGHLWEWPSAVHAGAGVRCE